jgi:UDP-2-acetamido-3-amino-2,3-dideoxy-glucuronate N-acetyltransferase
MNAPYISERSFVNEFVKLGNGTKIWHFCNIYGEKDNPVIIGDNTYIGSYSEIKPGIKIGNNCRFQSYVFIPEGVTIKDYVFLGPRVTFTNDKYPSAIKTIKKIWNLEKTYVDTHATICANSVIGPGVNIGKYSLVGMGSVVIEDVPDYAVVYGNPAEIKGTINNLDI